MTPRERARSLAVRYGPYLLTAAVLFAILRKYPLGDITHAMAAGRAWPLFPIAMTFALVNLLIIAAWDTLVFGSVRYLDVVRVKAGCSVLQSIAYLANQGAYGTWLARTTGRGARAAVGLLLFTALSDFTSGALLATLVIHGTGVRVPTVLSFGAPLGFVIGASVLLGPARLPVTERPTVPEALRSVPRGPGAVQMFGRICNSCLMILAVWTAARAFGLALPLGAAFTFVPIIILIGSLPVNVFGFGPVQGAWLLFTPWVPGPQILAFQILWNFSLIIANVLRGVAFVPRILREVAEAERPVHEAV